MQHPVKAFCHVNTAKVFIDIDFFAGTFFLGRAKSYVWNIKDDEYYICDHLKHDTFDAAKTRLRKIR